MYYQYFLLQTQLAALEGLSFDEVEDIALFAAGAPVSDERCVSDFAAVDLELNVRLRGGKVHGSLARAGQ